jgi:hypothetical protein
MKELSMLCNARVGDVSHTCEPTKLKKTKVGLYWFKSYGEFIEIQNEIHLCEREEPALVSFSPQG